MAGFSVNRTMIFVDGENLTMRFQDMVKTSDTQERVYARDNTFHKKDICVWPSAFRHSFGEIIRVYYYTSAPGSPEDRDALCDEIKKCELYGRPTQIDNLYPVVFPKPYKTRKSKAVDIQMTVDILTHVYQNNLDTVYLISGDGDFVPVIQEAMRAGKRVYVGALSVGLNPAMKRIADGFIALDSVLFMSAEEAARTNRSETTDLSNTHW